MRGRTFLRTMIENLFINNSICQTIIALVKFCNEQCYNYRKELKFSKKMPLNNIENNNNYKNRFIFNNTYNSGVHQK